MMSQTWYKRTETLLWFWFLFSFPTNRTNDAYSLAVSFKMTREKKPWGIFESLCLKHSFTSRSSSYTSYILDICSSFSKVRSNLGHTVYWNYFSSDFQNPVSSHFFPSLSLFNSLFVVVVVVVFWCHLFHASYSLCHALHTCTSISCTRSSERNQPVAAKLLVFVLFMALKKRIPLKICILSRFV